MTKKIRLSSYLKKYWFFALLSPLFMAGEVICDLYQPKFMAEIVNTVVKNGGQNVDFSIILMTGVKMLLIVLLGGVMGLLCCWTASRASQGFGHDIRVDSFNKVMSLSLEQTDKFTTGSLVTRMTNDITTLQDMVQMILRMMIRAPIFFFGGLFMCLSLSVNFSLVVVVAFPIIIAVVIIMLVRAVPLFTEVQKKLDRVNSVVQENVTGARVVKAFTAEEREKAKFETANREYQKINLKVMYTLAAIGPILTIVMNLAVIAVIYIGGLQVQAEALQVGDVMAAAQYITRILSSIIMMTMMFQQFARGSACAKRVREVLAADTLIESGDRKEGTEQGTVRFENVSFRYADASGNDILSDISFDVKKGETVAIIGATGSGKSTLVNLIPRFYDATRGNVYVDGVNVRDWDSESLREKIGFVLQKSELFSGTIADNISWGKDNATREEIVEAARVAQADEFISRMVSGYDSPVAEKGASLSGGQKQRIAISRAVLRKPEIMIFDDSTSALDLVTESKLHKALGEELGETTVIMIAQRIASVMHADRIAVIEGGKITAFDSHDNLMKSSETYRDIYSSQMKTSGGATA